MKTMREKYPTATIVGSGIMGLVLAWSLNRDGVRVRILEPDSSEGKTSTSYFAGGMLSPISELEIASQHIHELGMKSLDLWEDILTDIDARQFLKLNGSLCIAHERDVPLLKRFAEKIRAAGFEEHNYIRAVKAEEIAELEPALKGRFSVGYYINPEGHLSPREVMTLLRSTLEKRGVEFIPGQSVNFENGKLQTDHKADLNIDCRGVGAQDRFSDLRGVKGEMAIVRTKEVSLNRPVRIMHPRYPLYIVPRDDHHFMIGATEIESHDMDHVSVRSALELLSALYAVHPSFGEADIIEMGTHLRPAFSDNEPQIFHEADQMAINGLYRHGYLIAPALAKEASDMISDGGKLDKDQVA